ncbi:MAG: DUF1569 domain-containing protein [Bacteroidota bacterium]
MKTIFDKPTRDELITRINTLNEHSKAQWGKMTVYQMLRHCSMWEEMCLGRQLYRQSFLGHLVGKFALKDMLKDEPIKRNLPTVPGFKITDSGDVSAEKAKWIDLIRQHDDRVAQGFVHPFFGKLTPDQAGQMAYKHIDHHLRQFNA